MGMDIQLGHPEFLWGLCLLPLVGMLTVRSRALLSLRARLIASLIRSIVVALVILALAQPHRMEWQQRPISSAVACLLDRSASLDDCQGDVDARRAEYVSLAGQADRLVDVCFARTSWLAGQSAPSERDGTNIEAGLERVRAELGGSQGAVILISDGRATAGSALEAAARLRAEGLTVHVVPVGVRKPIGPRIVGVEPPPRGRVQEPAQVRVRVQSDYPARVELRLLDSQGMEVDRQAANLDAERTFVLRHVPTEPGLQKCTVVLMGGVDLAGEQTLVSAPYIAEGPPKVLLVDTLPEETIYLETVLRDLGVVVDVRPCEGLLLAPQELNTYEAVVLSDCAGPDFGPDMQQHLARYVEEQGGGLIFVAGRNVSPKRWKDAPLEKVLPVRFLPEPTKVVEEQRPAHVCFVLDKSGSMDESLGSVAGGAISKLDHVKDAVHASVHELPATALVSVIVFDEATHRLVERMPAREWPNVAGQIDALVASGGTIMDTALEAAIDLLAADKEPGYIILLTDGMTYVQSDSPLARWRDLVRRIADADITLTTVAMGHDADVNLLQFLARKAGGSYHYCDRADDLPTIFIRQARTIKQVSRTDRMPFRPRAGPAAERIRGIPLEEYPALEASVLLEARPLSQVVLQTDKDAPLLAAWRYGLGHVVAFASDAKPAWARRWVMWEQFARFWSQLASWVIRSQQRWQVKVEPIVQDRDVRILVRVRDTEGRPVPGLRASGTASPIAGSAQQAVPLRWQETRPGLYEASCTLSSDGNHLCQMQLDAPGQAGVQHVLVLRPAGSAEPAATGPDLSALESIAAAGGGVVNPSPAQIVGAIRQASSQRVPTSRQFWPWLTLAAILLWPVDVAVRRWLE